jgi:deazaflavin-dependent oxidoreductase (nitroreductase family)
MPEQPDQPGQPDQSGHPDQPGQPDQRDHYKAPGRPTRSFNSMVAALTRSGVSVWGSRILEVRGRKSGLPRRTPVNLLVYEGQEYLVAPRGQTEWVRNLRADDGRLALILGRRREDARATELPDSEKVPVLRAYLRRWKTEIGVFFEGVGPDSSDDQIAAIAGRHPVFRLSPG